MAGKQPSGMEYLPRESPIHRLCGATKLLMVLLWSVAAMITYDTRFLAGMILLSFAVFALSKIKLRDIRFVLVLISVLMILNSLTIFLFSPEEGVKIYGTRHEIVHLFGRYTVTQEQLFYLLNVVLKYFCVLPVALIFITTTEPSEFASSLNRLGVGYRAGYSVALALRYIPDVKRDFTNISQAQQARGIDTSKKAKLLERFKNAVLILFPLLFSSLSRIDVIANAMELRGFGKSKKRTWYAARPFGSGDYLMIGFSVLLLALSLTLNVLNGGRFYNPFI